MPEYGFDREFGHQLVANLGSAWPATGREFRHHRAILIATQRYPTYLQQLAGAVLFQAGRLARVLSRFTNTESSDAGIREQGGVEIGDQNHGVPEPRHQCREVSIAGHQTQVVDWAGVQQVHGVDDQRDVHGVLSRLIDHVHRLHPTLFEHSWPCPAGRGCPISVGTVDVNVAVGGGFGEHGAHLVGGEGVGVDEDSHPPAPRAAAVPGDFPSSRRNRPVSENHSRGHSREAQSPSGMAASLWSRRGESVGACDITAYNGDRSIGRVTQ